MQCWHSLYCNLKQLLQDWHCSILMYIFSFFILHHWNKQNATVSECHESLWFKQMLSHGIVVCTDYNTVLFSNIIQGNLLYKKKKGCFLFFILFFIHYKCRPCFNSNSLKSIKFNLFSSIAMNFDALIDILKKEKIHQHQ